MPRAGVLMGGPTFCARSRRRDARRPSMGGLRATRSKRVKLPCALPPHAMSEVRKAALRESADAFGEPDRLAPLRCAVYAGGATRDGDAPR